MGFNTYGKTSETYGGGIPVWLKVDNVDYGGGTIDISGKSAGDIIPAGSMCYLDKMGGTLAIIASTAAAEVLATVNGLLLNDIVIEAGDTYATGAVVYAGNVYADRIPTVPATVKTQLTQIRFTYQ